MADVDLGKPPSDKEMARAQFGLGWSSKEEREEVEVQEDFNDSEIKGLIRTIRIVLLVDRLLLVVPSCPGWWAPL